MRIVRSFLVLYFFAAVILVNAPVAFAAGEANASCNPVTIDTCKKCGYELDPKTKKCAFTGKNRYLCPCGETAFLSNRVTGVCLRPNFCDTKSAPDEHGGSGGLTNMGDFMKALGPIMQGAGMVMGLMNKGGSGGGSGSGAGTGAGVGTGYNGCTQYTPTSDSNQASANPCYYYVPPTSTYTDTSGVAGGTSGDPAAVSKGLFDALFGSGGDGSGDASDGSGGTAQSVGTTTSSSTIKIQINPNATSSSLQPGLRGDIREIKGGATVLVGNRDIKENKEVVGFYGSQATQGQTTTLVGSWCATRPWATNFLKAIIPSTFFDSLCTLRGYKVGTGTANAKPKVSVTQTKSGSSTFTAPLPKATTTKAVAPSVDAKVDIWAVPERVTLGSRTTVFWSAKGVDKCEVASPDGSFSHETLSGGAATVPLTQATTYTISCIKPDGKPITNYVTVQLRN